MWPTSILYNGALISCANDEETVVDPEDLELTSCVECFQHSNLEQAMAHSYGVIAWPDRFWHVERGRGPFPDAISAVTMPIGAMDPGDAIRDQVRVQATVVALQEEVTARAIQQKHTKLYGCVQLCMKCATDLADPWLVTFPQQLHKIQLTRLVSSTTTKTRVDNAVMSRLSTTRKCAPSGCSLVTCENKNPNPDQPLAWYGGFDGDVTPHLICNWCTQLQHKDVRWLQPVIPVTSSATCSVSATPLTPPRWMRWLDFIPPSTTHLCVQCNTFRACLRPFVWFDSVANNTGVVTLRTYTMSERRCKACVMAQFPAQQVYTSALLTHVTCMPTALISIIVAYVHGFNVIL